MNVTAWGFTTDSTLIQSVTERCGQILGTSSIHQNKKKISISTCVGIPPLQDSVEVQARIGRKIRSRSMETWPRVGPASTRAPHLPFVLLGGSVLAIVCVLLLGFAGESCGELWQSVQHTLQQAFAERLTNQIHGTESVLKRLQLFILACMGLECSVRCSPGLC
jgi:hypothetical protein